MAKRKLGAIYGLLFAIAAALMCAFALTFDIPAEYASAEEPATLTELDVSGTASGQANDFTDGTWKELTDGGTLASGKYYLTQDITLSERIYVSSGKTVTIDLNGYTIIGPSVTTNNHIIYIPGGSLTIEDSNTANRTHYYTAASESAASSISTE